MLTSTNKLDTKYLTLGALLAPIIEKSPFRTECLLLTSLYIDSGVRVTGPVLIRTKMAHPRNIRGAIKILVDAGYLEKRKVERRLGFKILLTEKGLDFVNRTSRLVKQQFKSVLLH